MASTTTAAAATTRVRRKPAPKLNPEDEQAVLAAAAVQEKLEGAEDNDGDEPRPLPQRAPFALYPDYPVSFSVSYSTSLEFLAGAVCIL
jgi:hypothetical protein